MEGHHCPRLAGFLRLTRKLKAKIQKKNDDRKDTCPICGSKSNRGNLCRSCFTRSFRPIAYTRNIKVVEQNEYFYGAGNDKHWGRKVRTKANPTTGKGNNDILNLVLYSTETVESSSEIFAQPKDPVSDKTLYEDSSSSADPTQLTNKDKELQAVENVPSRELLKVELEDTGGTEAREILNRCTAFVPGFWENPTEEDQQHGSSKVKTFTDRVVKEVKRPFKAILCDSDTEFGLSASTLTCEKTSIDQSINVDIPQNAQVDRSRMRSQSDMPARISPSGDADHVSLSKRLKQNAISELLKVAFKTNLILNCLYQYFKKVVETDGSNSENSGSDPGDVGSDSENYRSNPSESFDDAYLPLQRAANPTTGSKISIDSFFFLDRQNTVLQGLTESNGFECNSDTEVISKSQATLSLLMAPFENEALGYGAHEYDNSGYRLAGPSTKFLMTPLDESTDRLVSRKFHSEHFKLNPKHPDECQDGERKASSGQYQGSSILIMGDAETGKWSSHTRGVYSIEPEPNSVSTSQLSGKSLLDLVFGLNRTCVKPSLVPLPECQADLITLSSPVPSKDDIVEPKTRKDADSQTALSPQHLEQEMNHLHEAFLDQLSHFSVQLLESCKTFGHSWQTSFLAELVDHFRTACSIVSSAIGEPCLAVPSPARLDELQDVSNQISICLAKLRAHPHSFMGDCSDHDICSLLSSPAEHQVDTWV